MPTTKTATKKAATKKPATKKAATKKAATKKAATKKVTTTAAATATASGDLPRISKPANRVLAEIGVTTRAQLANYTAADLLALHGFGPKGIAILKAAKIKLKG
jgi:predicted flap endonuclease-1-like 5' DNA nuclease